jgi:hypothetical protein
MPTAPDSPELVHPAVLAEGRRPVLASGCGAVSTFLAEPGTVEVRRAPQRHGAPADAE